MPSLPYCTSLPPETTVTSDDAGEKAGLLPAIGSQSKHDPST
jgi:hypothetical protein